MAATIKLLLWASFCLIWSLAMIIGGFYRLWDYLDFVLADVLDKESFDFIIVGAGSAGSVLANRLSKNNKVLVLEAGGDPVFLHQYPGFNPDLLHHSLENWAYETVPQEFSHFGFRNNVSLWPRGKCLGGTGVLNGLKYVRGHPLDYDNWATLTGDESWKYGNILQYFKKSIKYRGNFGFNKKHYENGPYGFLHVEDRTYRPLHKYFIQAALEAGFSEIDVNGPQRIGFGLMEGTQNFGRRSDPYTAFLKPILTRKNLRILRYAHVAKIELDSENRATGVWFHRHGKLTFAKATKEIIISAGAVDSPKLLMLSGIGPKKALAVAGIPQRLDLPVGQNLMDHVSVIIPGFRIAAPDSFLLERDYTLDILSQFISEGKGPFTNPTVDTTQGFVALGKASGTKWPNVQLYSHSFGNTAVMAQTYSEMMGYDLPRFQEFVRHLPVSDGFALDPILVRPKSRGEITLKDGNYLTPPIIDPKYLSHPEDSQTLIEAVKFFVDLVINSKAFQQINTTWVQTPYPSCKHWPFGSDPYWECYIRHMGMTLYHPSGTCRMGKATDPHAVVDSQLRVLGTKGLRVADASIMPVIVNGNTNAPCMMIAEKVADEIRNQRLGKRQLKLASAKSNDFEEATTS